MKVVIVDDSEAIRKVLRAICEGEGHEIVAEFPDGEGLLDCVRGARPDVVCLDYELPGRNGFELLAEMDHAASRPEPGEGGRNAGGAWRSRCFPDRGGGR